MGTLFRLLCFTLVLFWSSPSFSTPYFPEHYDAEIQRATKQYWADLPAWKLWKAQLYQESRLDPNVCSQVGACGLAQFMPDSWQDVVRGLQWDRGSSPFDARLAIEAGAFYQAQLRGKWRKEGRTALERNDLGLCAYNRGLGNCLKDQAECRNGFVWKDIEPCTANHTMETVIYIKRINEFWQRMEVTR